MRATFLGLLSLISVAVVTPGSARAESCAAVYDSAFTRLRASAARGTSQSAADHEAENVFGPRAVKCEEGAYQRFLDSFEAFAREAIRAAQPLKVGKKVTPPPPGSDSLLRLTIAALKKSPSKVPAKEAKAAIAGYRQVRSNLSAVVEDSGSTLPMNDLLNAMSQIKAPEAAEDLPPGVNPTPTSTYTPTPTVSTSTPTTTEPRTTTSGAVTQIRIPGIALPTWAVIKIYEARDAASLKDSEVAKSKLQDVIVWIESVTQGQQ